MAGAHDLDGPVGGGNGHPRGGRATSMVAELVWQQYPQKRNVHVLQPRANLRSWTCNEVLLTPA